MLLKHEGAFESLKSLSDDEPEHFVCVATISMRSDFTQKNIEKVWSLIRVEASFVNKLTKVNSVGAPTVHTRARAGAERCYIR